jgi:hypothetical protein
LPYNGVEIVGFFIEVLMARYILVFFLFISSVTVSAEESLPKELPPEQEVAAIQSAETTGLSIFRHDQAAAVATDAAFKLRAFKKDKRVRGWITEERDGQIVVTFKIIGDRPRF